MKNWKTVAIIAFVVAIVLAALGSGMFGADEVVDGPAASTEAK